MLYAIGQVLFRWLFRYVIPVRVHGVEHIPREGATILCANHISLWDPPLVGTPVPRRVYYMAKDDLFRIPIFGTIIRNLGAFPVKRGGISKDSIREATRILAEGKVMGIFPEGSRKNRKGQAKKGAARLALRSDAVVIPVAIVGKYRFFRKMHIIYGEPVDLSMYRDGSAESVEAATHAIMQRIYSMIEHPPAS